jgi:hypothetical protein
LLDETWINDKYNTIDCYRRLCDIRREHDLSCAFRGRFEYLGLHITWQIGVYGADNQLGYFVAQGPCSFCQILLRCFNLVLPLKENKVSYIKSYQYEDTHG